MRQNATHYDIFPTLAAALDLPLSSELPGAPMAELFCQEVEVETVKSYGAFTPPIAAPPPYDETELDALRSLGYVE